MVCDKEDAVTGIKIHNEQSIKFISFPAPCPNHNKVTYNANNEHRRDNDCPVYHRLSVVAPHGAKQSRIRLLSEDLILQCTSLPVLAKENERERERDPSAN